MKLSTRGRYAVMAMVDLTQNSAGQPVALAEISDRQDISLSYLEQLFSKLRRAGLVQSVRGPGGGYKLADAAEDIRVSEVILAVDEPIQTTSCTLGTSVGCIRKSTRCMTHDLWEELGHQIHGYLSSVSLADVCAGRIYAGPMRSQDAPVHEIAAEIGQTRAVDIYLDHNATTPVRPEVAEAMVAALVQTGNASSVHRFGRLARRGVDDAREAVAQLVGAPAANVVFTSGGTEANNLALRGPDRPVIISAVEHNSVLSACADATIVSVDPAGVLDLDHLRAVLEASDVPALVSVMYANNETGVLQPVEEVMALAHEFGALVHCDAIQAAGKLPVPMEALGVDLLSLSAHKIGGPQGSGALIVRAGLDLEPLLRGGGQERRRRAGTENVPGIVGFGTAARWAAETLTKYAEIAPLRDAMEARLLECAPDALVHGAKAERLANTSCIGLPDVTGEIQVMTFDLAGVAVSAGSACSSGKVTPSHVLRAMGQDDDAARSAIRVSLGLETRPDEIDRFVEIWWEMAMRRPFEDEARRSVA